MCQVSWLLRGTVSHRPQLETPLPEEAFEGAYSGREIQGPAEVLWVSSHQLEGKLALTLLESQ